MAAQDWRMNRAPADEIALGMAFTVMGLLSHLVKRGEVDRGTAETIIDKTLIEIHLMRASAPPMQLELLTNEHIVTWFQEILDGLGSPRN